MVDPVTNALALQMEYGDEELQKDIHERICLIVREEIRDYISKNNGELMRQLIVNNAYDFNRQVLRAVKEQFNNPQQIY